MAWWTEEEISAFLAAVEGDDLDDLFHVALDTGARQGELFALRWRDVDLSRGQLVIRASISQAGRRRKEPKSRRGTRPIDLSPSVVERLRARKMSRRVVGLDEEELVFPGQGGIPLHASRLKRHLDVAIGRSGVKLIRFHDLRHTHATLALQHGEAVPNVAARLGHDPATLLRVYAHAVPPASRSGRAGFLEGVRGAIAPKIAPNEGA
jgi:integrase